MSETQKRKPCDLIIGNAYIVTMDNKRRIFANGAVAIGDTRILAVGNSQAILAEYEPEQFLDAHGAVVTPGFVDSHTHVSLTTIRDLFNDVPGESKHANQEIANTYHDYVEALTDEDEYASSLLASGELLLNGYTAVMDPGTVFEPDCAAKAMETVGIRGSLGEPFLIDRVATQTSGHSRAPLSRERCEKLLGNQLWRNRNPENLVRGHVAVYGMGANSLDFTLQAIQFAQAEGAPFTQHLSTAPDDHEDFIKECGGVPPLVKLGQAGVFNENNGALNFVHCNLVSEEEIHTVGEAGVSVSWNPVNPLYYGLASEMPCRMGDLYRAGGNVALCNDVINSWAPSDIFLIAHLHGRAYGDYVSTEMLMEMSTINAARAIGMNAEIGSIEVGKRADIVIRSLGCTEAEPSSLPLYAHMLRARSRSVDTVLVNGRIVVEGGKLVLIDQAEIVELANKSRQKIAKAIDFRAPMTWPVL